jgi:hypothetical protein
MLHSGVLGSYGTANLKTKSRENSRRESLTSRRIGRDIKKGNSGKENLLRVKTEFERTLGPKGSSTPWAKTPVQEKISNGEPIFLKRSHRNGGSCKGIPAQRKARTAVGCWRADSQAGTDRRYHFGGGKKLSGPIDGSGREA